MNLHISIGKFQAYRSFLELLPRLVVVPLLPELGPIKPNAGGWRSAYRPRG